MERYLNGKLFGENMKTKTILTSIIGILLVISILNLTSALVVIKDIEVSPGEIAPGEISTIKITVENAGNEDLKDVVIAVDLTNVPFVPKDSSTEKIIEKLDEDDKEKEIFKIQALDDAPSGTYKIPVKITYIEDYEEKIRNDIVSLTINSKPEISLEWVDGLLLKNQKNVLNIKIINKGLSDIKFLEVNVNDAIDYNVLSSKYIYIGDINSDDFDTSEFEIFFKQSTKDNIVFPLRLTYRDITNKEYAEDYLVDLKVYDKKQAYELGILKKSRTGIYVGIVVLIVIVWYVARRIRKAKRLKKQKGK